MATARIELRTYKVNSRGESPIAIAVRSGTKRSFISTGFRVKKAHWNQRLREVRKTHPDQIVINGRSLDVLRKAEEAIAKLTAQDRSVDVQEIRRMVTDSHPQSYRTDFFELYHKELDRYEREGKFAARDAYNVALGKLKLYWERESGKSSLSFDEVDVALLEGFMSHLVSEYGNGESTIHKNMSSIRTILRTATRHGLFPDEKDPFRHIKLKKGHTKKRALTPSQIESLKDLDVSSDALILARKVFLFSFYTGGMRISDVLRLRSENILLRENEYRISYKMKKTGGQPYEIPLFNEAKEILESFGWPDDLYSDLLFPCMLPELIPDSREEFRQIKTATARINKNLVRLGKMCNFDIPLTMHVARHTFANFMNASNLSVSDIQQLLGHSSLRSTEAYLRSITTDHLDDAVKKALSIF